MVKASVTLFISISFIFIFSLCPEIIAETTVTDAITIIYCESAPYVSLVELADKFNLKLSFNQDILCMTVQKGGKSLTLTNSSRTIMVGRTPINMVLPARLIRGAMYAPVPDILPFISKLIPCTLIWNSQKQHIEISGGSHTIKKITCETFSNGTRIHIALTHYIPYSVERTKDNLLQVVFENGDLSSDSLSPKVTGLIKDCNITQDGADARLSFVLLPEVDNITLSRTSSPDELHISLFKKRLNSTALPETVSMPVKSPMLPSNDELWLIDTIVIDPGHGGQDTGAIGPKGTREKDIVLAVAKELKKIFDDQGEIKTIMTRDKDEFIPLYKRARIANNAHGKLFVSIHANASKNHDARGIEIFFLSAAKTEDAQKVADRENASIKLEDNLTHYTFLKNNSSLTQELADIQRDMISNVFLKESQDMCDILLTTTLSATRQENRGVKQAGFYVMLGTQASMPSVLFEIGFITNPDEEKLLNRTSYQKRLAYSMYDAIITFKTKHERGLFSRSE